MITVDHGILTETGERVAAEYRDGDGGVCARGISDYRRREEKWNFRMTPLELVPIE